MRSGFPEAEHSFTIRTDRFMGLLEKAIVLATQAHAGQLDTDGSPYIFHPLRLMLVVHTPEQQMAAVLHDTLEHTQLSVQDLEEAGFPASVIEAVRILTRPEDEPRMSAARRAMQHPIAYAVKLADVRDNMDMRRIPNPTAADYERQEEYRHVLQLLTG